MLRIARWTTACRLSFHCPRQRPRPRIPPASPLKGLSINSLGARGLNLPPLKKHVLMSSAEGGIEGELTAVCSRKRRRRSGPRGDARRRRSMIKREKSRRGFGRAHVSRLDRSARGRTGRYPAPTRRHEHGACAGARLGHGAVGSSQSPPRHRDRRRPPP